MELAVLDTVEETLSSLFRGESFVCRLDFACNGRLGLVLFVVTRRVHRRREEYVGGETIEEALRTKTFRQPYRSDSVPN